MGRPKSPQKRAAILDAAGDLFLAHGLQSTSMDAVAQQAGVSKQTVYSHFASKEELFRAVIANKVQAYGFGEAELPAGDDVGEALFALGRRFMDLLFDREVVAMYRVVIGESVLHPKIAQLFFASGPESTARTIERFLSRQVREGRLRIDDVPYAAAQFLGMVCGHHQMLLLMSLRPELGEAEMNGHIRRAVGQFMTLYGAPREGL